MRDQFVRVEPLLCVAVCALFTFGCGNDGSSTAQEAASDTGLGNETAEAGTSHVDAPDAPLRANAGDDLRVSVGTSTTLDGSASSGAFVRWEWDFDIAGGDDVDAEGTNQQPIAHVVYRVPGTYRAVLRIYDERGAVAADEILVEVLEDTTLPTAIAHVPNELVVGELATFDGSASFDDVGVVELLWDYNISDGGEFDATGEETTFAYASPGRYTGLLGARDAAGNLGVAQFEVWVSPTLDETPPEAITAQNQRVHVGAPVPLDGRASHDDRQIVRYSWNKDVDDSVEEDAATALYEATYSSVGVYTARLTVWDEAGNSDSSETQVEVVNDVTPPLAHLDVPGSVPARTLVTLDASASHDDVAISEYRWRIEGHAEVVTAEPFYVTSFDEAGLLRVELIVRDGAGLESTAVALLRVSDATPVLYFADPQAVRLARVGDTQEIDVVARYEDGSEAIVSPSRITGHGEGLVWDERGVRALRDGEHQLVLDADGAALRVPVRVGPSWWLGATDGAVVADGGSLTRVPLDAGSALVDIEAWGDGRALALVSGSEGSRIDVIESSGASSTLEELRGDAIDLVVRAEDELWVVFIDGRLSRVAPVGDAPPLDLTGLSERELSVHHGALLWDELLFIPISDDAARRGGFVAYDVEKHAPRAPPDQPSDWWFAEPDCRGPELAWIGARFGVLLCSRTDRTGNSSATLFSRVGLEPVSTINLGPSPVSGALYEPFTGSLLAGVTGSHEQVVSANLLESRVDVRASEGSIPILVFRDERGRALAHDGETLFEVGNTGELSALSSVTAIAPTLSATEVSRSGRWLESDDTMLEGAFAGDGFSRLQNVLGPPTGRGTGAQNASPDDLVTIPDGETLEVRLIGWELTDGFGSDLVVYENAFNAGGRPYSRWMEPATLAFSSDGVEWVPYPVWHDERFEFGDPRYVVDGWAGVAPVLANEERNGLASGGRAGGGDRFDLAMVGLESACCIRISDIPSDGYTPDLDSIVGIHWRELALVE